MSTESDTGSGSDVGSGSGSDVGSGSGSDVGSGSGSDVGSGSGSDVGSGSGSDVGSGPGSDVSDEGPDQRSGTGSDADADGSHDGARSGDESAAGAEADTEGSDDDGASTDAGGADVRGVFDILAGVETETEFARVDARLEEIAGDVERLVAEVERETESRRGELEVMRARVEDALTHIGDATEEHRDAWRDLDGRLTELRTELTAESAGMRERLQELLAGAIEPLRSEVDALELRTQADIEQSAAGLRETVEHVRRELEATAGELRAGQRFTSGELEERVGEVVASAVAGMRETVAAHSETIERERTARAGADRAVADRLDHIEARLERLENRTGTGQGRTELELTRLERQLGELGERVTATESRSGGDAHERVAAEIAELTARIERAEAIAREAGRVIVATVRQGRGAASAGDDERADPADVLFDQ